MSQLQLSNSLTRSERVKKTHIDAKSILSTKVTYSREELLQRIKDINILQFLGKGRNRTLIKDYPEIYKSIIHHTDYFSMYTQKKQSVPFALRLLLVSREFQHSRDMFCKCGKGTSFDVATQSFTKLYCHECRPSSRSKIWHQDKFGDSWENEYNKFITQPHRVEIRQRAGRKSWNVRKERSSRGTVVCLGRNEKSILDFIEAKNNIILERQVEVDGYYVDGYCRSTNTVYEVYERYHKYQKERDDKRTLDIINTLQCEFIVIFDNDNVDYEGLKITKYV
jgi:hypothetical protein